MKIQLDLDNKKIKVEEAVNLGKLFENLESLLPLGKWREFELQTNVTINWTNPIVINPEPYRNPYPYYEPWKSPFWYEQRPWLISDTININNADSTIPPDTTTSVKLNETKGELKINYRGTYNIQM